jgi:hypothetical protein
MPLLVSAAAEAHSYPKRDKPMPFFQMRDIIGLFKNEQKDFDEARNLALNYWLKI